MFSIGVDIEKVARFEHLINNKPSLLKKIFTVYEWEYASKKQAAQTLAGIWCAKEAVIKALPSNLNLSIPSIHINHDIHGEPFIDDSSLFEIGKLKIKISISHTSESAVAMCVILNL